MSYRRDKTTPVNLYQMLIIYLVLPVSLECESDQCCNIWKTHACNAVLQALRIALWSWGNKGLKFWKKSARLETHLVHQKIFYSQYCSAVCRSCSLRCEITWSFIKEKSLLAEKKSLFTERLPRSPNQIASATLQKCCICSPGASMGVLCIWL